MTLVHVTLKPGVRDNAEAKEAVRRLLEQVHGLRRLNVKRFDRYGILSGDVDDAMVPKIAQLAEVEAVEQDRERSSM
ncbi:MAG: hypothetical protein IPK26_19985 [Planctomycetes bacterium]|nr:hypothetical protein [Planctomycetota bacterium]